MAAPEIADDAVSQEPKQAVETVKQTKKQLQGKLLYRKNQARKLEKAAEVKNPELKEKVRKLNEEIRKAYTETEPKLSEVYSIQDDLQGLIDAMNAKN